MIVHNLQLNAGSRQNHENIIIFIILVIIYLILYIIYIIYIIFLRGLKVKQPHGVFENDQIILGKYIMAIR